MNSILGDGRFSANSEVLLDTETSGYETNVETVRLASGGLIAVWLDDSQVQGATSFIRGQMFDAAGAKIGGEFEVARGAGAPAVAALAGGGFVVGWRGANGLDENVQGKIYNAAGIAVSGIFDLNADPASGQSGITLTALSGGGFVAAWQEHDMRALSTSIEARIFTATGVATTGDFSVAAWAIGNSSPTITELSSGNIAIAYRGGSSSDGVNANINGRVFDTSGTAMGPIFTTNGLVTYPGAYSPALLTLSTGNMLLSWVAYQNGTPVAVMAQIFAANGSAVGQPITVSTTVGSYTTARASVTEDGFAIVYGKATSADPFNANAKQTDVALRLFDVTGAPVGAEFLINSITSGEQTQPSISMFGSNDMAIAFTDSSNSRSDVKIRILFNVTGGTPGNDTLTGTAGDDELSGFAGNDKIIGRLGNDVIDGGVGYDQAVLASYYRASTITLGSTISVMGPDGSDTMTGIERLAFIDGDFIIDPNSVGAQVTRMYDTVLGRAPDAFGLDNWVDRIEDLGWTLAQVAGAFATSAEFTLATGGLNNAAFVDYVYQHALGRAADASGRANWISFLEGGMTRGEMLVGFSESLEHRNLIATIVGQGYFQTDDTFQTVALLYDSFAGRLPDASGLKHWATLLKTGTMTLGQVAEGFAGSLEFQQFTSGMNHGQLVDFMYQNTLDRLPDAAGRQHWVQQLDAGMSDGALLLGFSQSAEHIALFQTHIVGGIDYFG